ncbi:hypothetical protein MRX96_051464 [Rhipicephalus microplus]
MSGPGSSTTGGMLSNPFCFVLQVLAVLQEIRLSQRGCLPGIKQAELLRRYGPEPSPLADYGISSIKSPHTARWPLRPSSVTSHHVSILEATKGREPASHPSGPGSSTTGGMLSNPFCFVLQVLAVLQEIRLSQRGCLPGIKQAELLRRYGPEPSPLADYGISSIKSPHTARWPLRPSSVTSHHVSILEATKGVNRRATPVGQVAALPAGCSVIPSASFFRFWLCFKKFGYHSAAASLESSKPNCYADMDRSHRRLPTTVSAASKVLTPQDGHCDHLR